MEDWDWDTGGLDPNLLYSGSDLGFNPDTFYGGLSPDLSSPEFNIGNISQGFDISGISPLDLSTIDTRDLVDFGIDVGLGSSENDLSKYIPETTYTEEQTPFVPKDVDVLSGYVPSDSPTEEELKEQYWKEALGAGTAVPGTGVITRDKDGNPVIKYGDGSTKTLLPGGDTKVKQETIIDKIIKTIKDPTGSGKSGDNALLYALLGGLMGLLTRNQYAKLPVGYQGGIPKKVATRGESVSATAGGRRPGGAGIGSLAGQVTYKNAAQGGLMNLAAGGQPARYLRGGTDGMADKIHTSIDGKQPARLSHGEFVIPADVVSHLGNGNSDAGADVLYEMMDKVRTARTGTKKQGKQINPRKYIPA